MFNEVPIARGLRLAFGSGIAGMAFLALTAHAQTSGPDQVQRGEKVEVTGSSIKRIDAESALPVQVITRDDIQKIAPQNTEQLLRSLSVTNSVNAITTSMGAGATTGGVSTVSLRGIGSNRTLVLVNGRRLPSFGGLANGGAVSSVDVNSIPLGAIDRVEVLKDGASAIYGSDAIAGVINFILRSDYTGALVEAQYGQTTHGGDGRSYSSDAVLGFGDLQKDRFNVMITASEAKDQAIYGAQRQYASTAVGLNGDNDYTSGNTYPANIVLPSGASRNFLAPGYNGLYGTGGCAPSITTPRTSQSTCRYDTAPVVALVPDQRRATVGFNGQFAITPDTTAYADLTASRIITKTTIQASPISDQFALNANNPYTPTYNQLLANNTPALDGAYGTGFASSLVGFGAVLLPTTSPYYPTQYAAANGLAGSPLDLRYRSVEAGGRSVRDETTAGRSVFGIKGTTLGWDYDLGVAYAQSRLKEFDTAGYLLYSQILPLLNSGVVNPFGPSTPAVRQQIQSTVYNGEAYNTKTQYTSINGHASREIFNLPAGAVSVALGADFRRESYAFAASDAYQTGDITGYGGNGIGISKARNIEAAFAELNVPLIKGLEADLAARFDNYENVGNTVNPKGSLRWQPVKELLFRASVGTGFRAPSLDELYAPVTQGVTANGLSDQLRCPTTGTSTDCNTQFTTANGGNARLQPEKSTSVSYGMVVEPTENVHFGVDYFDIKLRNTIFDTGIDAGSILDTLADEQKFGYLITRGPSTNGLPGPILSISQQSLNLYKQHVRGLDFDVKVRFPAAVGSFTAALNGSYFLSDDLQNQDGSYSGVVANANAYGGSVIPRWKHTATLSYDYGPWGGSVIQNFQSGYQDLPANYTGDNRRVGAYETFDVQGVYSGVKHVRLTLGMKNVFDKDPPYSNVGGALYFQSGYDASYGDVHGRFIYARASYEFK